MTHSGTVGNPVLALSTVLVHWPASIGLLALVIKMNQCFHQFLGQRRRDDVTT